MLPVPFAIQCCLFALSRGHFISLPISGPTLFCSLQVSSVVATMGARAAFISALPEVLGHLVETDTVGGIAYLVMVTTLL